MQHKTKDKLWTDETGVQIPVNRVTKYEKLKEAHATKIAEEAKRINKKITDFKAEIRKLCQEVTQEAMIENGAKADSKGNFTWYNFDRSIKIEVSINERIDFDDLTISASKQKFDEFLNENIEGKAAFSKDIVIDAFTTSRGKLDAKKVMNLLKYRQKVKDAKFNEALDLLEKSIRRPDSRTYFRVFEKDNTGKYNNIDLNFSSID